MIDISGKKITKRKAIACGKIFLPCHVIERIKNNRIPKGEVLTTAEIAGLFAIKNTPYTVPHCHPVRITKATVNISYGDNFVQVKSEVEGIDRTGFEIEALHSVMVGLLTIYDMCKAFTHDAEIGEIKLIQKSGGKKKIEISR